MRTSVILLVVVSTAAGQGFRNRNKNSFRDRNRGEPSDLDTAASAQINDVAGDDDDDFQDAVQDLCAGRPTNEYFRLSTEGNCQSVVRCDRAGLAGTIRLASVKCPAGLSFDLEKQTCDWKANVDNCDRLSKPRKDKPNFNTEEPVCPDGQLQCATGECLEKRLFCNKELDCSDGSDENACSVSEDPNRAEACNLAECILPNCFCSADGTAAPGVADGQLEVSQLPMMISITFNGAINTENIPMYQDIFKTERINPNGCTAKGTFFVSHKYTNYSAVQELHRLGHEIGVFSITNNPNHKYWSQGSYDDWLAEMAGARLIVETFANISDGSVVGVRAPFLRTGGNEQFAMMSDQFFAYDSSIIAPLARVPVWPYTLDYRMPHKCHGNDGNCPSRSHLVWEMPINELDRRDDPDFDEALTGCHLVSSCSNIYDNGPFRAFLEQNFNHHYGTNRAPLSLSFDPSWLISNKGFVNVLTEWMDFVLATYNDVYFVSEIQVIQWMQNPTGSQQMREFVEWKQKCAVTGQPLCALPNPCPLTTRELPGETIRLHTCQECPQNYPWIQDPTGNGLAFK
jgi:hypothetical protein